MNTEVKFDDLKHGGVICWWASLRLPYPEVVIVYDGIQRDGLGNEYLRVEIGASSLPVEWGDERDVYMHMLSVEPELPPGYWRMYRKLFNNQRGNIRYAEHDDVERIKSNLRHSILSAQMQLDNAKKCSDFMMKRVDRYMEVNNEHKNKPA